MKDLFDPYDRTARLYPTYLTFAPVIVFVVVLALGSSEWWSTLGGIAVACGAPILAVQFSRSAGKRKEPALMAAWGGAPTLKLLRYRESGNNPVTVDRRHEVVAAATGIRLPTADEERDDPEAADAKYDAAVLSLRERTRDVEKFKLVFSENANYGFRRNLWGLKPFGLALAGLTAAVSAAILVWELVDDTRWPWYLPAVCAGFSLVVMVLWIVMVTPDWVRQTAFAYAERLLAAAELLPPRTS